MGSVSHSALRGRAVIRRQHSGLLTSQIRTERRTVAGGAELITFFQKAPLSTGETLDMPLVSVLKDTLDGSGEAERLRQVWAFSYSRPSFFRSLAGAVPFLYTRVPLPQRKRRANPIPYWTWRPRPGARGRRAQRYLQTQVFDPISFAVRLVTRSYIGNLAEYRRCTSGRPSTPWKPRRAQGDVGLAPEEMAVHPSPAPALRADLRRLCRDDYLSALTTGIGRSG